MNASAAMNVLRVIAAGALLLCAACNAGRDRSFDEQGSDAPAPALVKEYLLNAQRSHYYDVLLTSGRSEKDQPRDKGMMHIETEFQCPDRFRMKITGAVELERIGIGSTLYERRNQGPWTAAPMTAANPEVQRCQFIEKERERPIPDEAQVELMAGAFGSLQVTKGPIREYHGIKCQEYHSVREQRKIQSCYSTGAEPHLVHVEVDGATSNFFDFNQPIKIDAPEIGSPNAKRR